MADPIMEARGKAVIDFEVGGVEKVKETLTKLQAEQVSAANKVGQATERAAVAHNRLFIATEKLRGSQAANAAAIRQVTLAQDALYKAETNTLKALLALEKAQQAANAAAASSGVGAAVALATALDKVTIAERNLISANAAELQAQLKLNEVTEANTRANIQLVSAQTTVTAARVQESIATERQVQATQKLTAVNNQIKGYETELNSIVSRGTVTTQGHTAAINANTTAKQKNATAAGNHGNQLNNLTRIVNGTTQAINAMGFTGLKNNQILNTGFMQLGQVFGSTAGKALGLAGAVTTLVSSMTAAVIAVHRTTLEIKAFQNAVGGSTEAAGALSIAAQMVGNSSQDIAISLGFLNQTLLKGEQVAETAGAGIAKSIENIQDKLDKLETDKLQRLSDLIANLEDNMRRIQENIRDAQEQLELTKQNAAEDRDYSIAQAAEDLAEKLVAINDNKVEDLANLEDDHLQKVEDIQAAIASAEAEYAEDKAAEETKLQEKILDIQKAYAAKRLSLQEQFFNASPLLRPFIQAQIDALAGQQSAEEQLATDAFNLKMQKLEREYAEELAKLNLKLQREEEAYAESQQNIIDKATDTTAKIQAEYEKRVEAANRTYEKQVRSAEQAYAKQLDSFMEQQQKLQEEYQKTWDNVFREFNQALAEAYDNANEITSGLGGNAATNNPLAYALKQLGLNLEDLTKLDGPHILWEIAQALNKLPEGANKTGILNSLAGFFSPQMMNFVNLLGAQVGTFDEFVEKLAEQYPHLVKTKAQVDAAFTSFMEWNKVKLLITDLINAIGQELIPTSIQLAQTVQNILRFPTTLASDGEAFKKALLDIIKDIAKAAGEIVNVLFTDAQGNNNFLGNLFGWNPAGLKELRDYSAKYRTTFEEFAQGMRAATVTYQDGSVKSYKLTYQQIYEAIAAGNKVQLLETNTTLTSLRDDYFKKYGQIKENLTTDTGLMRQTIDTVTSKMLTTSQVSTTGIKTAFVTTFADASKAVTNNTSSMVTTLNTEGPKVKNALVKPVTDAKDVMSTDTFKQQFKDVGKNAAGSLVAAYGEKMLDFIINSLPAGIRDFLNAIRSAFNIQSPSKEMATLGNLAAAGFTTGYTETMTRFMQTTLPDMSSKFVVQTRDAGKYTVNNYANTAQVPAINIFTQPNQSPEEIAEVLMRELSRKMDVRLIGR